MTAGSLVPAARSTRARLMVAVPLTMALLVGATGYFAVSTMRQVYEVVGPGEVADHRVAQLGLQIAAISLIAAVLGFSIALGVTRPMRQMIRQLEALAAGDLRGSLQISSTSEIDLLGGAVNDAISALQRYYLQSMTGAVITLDADGRVIGSSTAAEATLGYREEDLVGRKFSDVFTPAAGSKAALVAVENAIAQRLPVSLDDVDIEAADGRPVRIGITASYLQRPGPSPDAARDVIGVTIAFKDLNEMHSLRARLQQAEQLAALGTLTAGVAHEIRNPLASIRGLTELLGRDLPHQDNRRRYVETILQSIDRLNRLIEDLLVFSAPKADDTTEVDLRNVVSETISLARHGLNGRALTLTEAPKAAMPLVVRGNRERIIQVLTNIVVNATQATPDEGTVTVSTDRREGTAVVAVHNTGSFIPPDVRRRLFVPFFTTKATGTGLGLAIAQQIVTALDGRIEVDSSPDSGTTFTIEMPLAVREEALA
jgi:two-component system sensor histidine kinase AtoS